MILKLIKYLRFKRWYYIGRNKIRKKIKKAAADGSIKVVLGSGDSNWQGWISTDLPHFDITCERDWNFFLSLKKADNLLAEHVLEHIEEKDVIKVLSFAYRYLNTGGIFRIAMPDGYNPDVDYIENVRPDGRNPEWGHKVLWNYKKLQSIIPIGFEFKLLEYYDEHSNLHVSDWIDEDGPISRCSKSVNLGLSGETSLIIDLIRNEN